MNEIEALIKVFGLPLDDATPSHFNKIIGDINAVWKDNEFLIDAFIQSAVHRNVEDRTMQPFKALILAGAMIGYLQAETDIRKKCYELGKNFKIKEEEKKEDGNSNDGKS
jgi:hypothetical protein